MQDEEKFLAPCGIRTLSRYHKDHPHVVSVMGHHHHETYEPTQSGTGLFGGNSNWRGTIWFPVNYLLIESLQKFHYFLGDQYQVEYPTGSGRPSTLWQVAAEVLRRLTHTFLQNAEGKRQVFGGTNRFHDDPHWHNHVLFCEYFHRDKWGRYRHESPNRLDRAGDEIDSSVWGVRTWGVRGEDRS